MTAPEPTMHENCEEERENARSTVRRFVTYIAASYVFGGPIILLMVLFFANVPDSKMVSALTIYALASGLAGMVVGWWFSKRDEERSRDS